jgi:hypothetical protein
MTAHEKINATHRNVYVALAAAQAEMEQVTKGSLNPAFKSRYADLADVVSVVRPALNRHGLAFFHQMIFPDGAIHMRTIIVHGESDTSIECDVPLIVGKNDMQGMKSATTYAKRIGLESVTGIAPEDDDGNAAAKAAPDPKEDHEAAVLAAIKAIGRETDMTSFAAFWADLAKRDRAVADDPRVMRAKEVRKTELAKPIDDEIPY